MTYLYPLRMSTRVVALISSAACLIVLAGSVAGCASTESVSTTYDAETDRVVYETNPIRIVRGGSGLGSSGQQIIYVKSQADCQGQACTPASVRILLSSGTRNVSWLDYDNVTIVADNWSRTWRNVSTREDPELIGIGEFMRLTIPIDEFRLLLQSRSMSIQVGGTSINLSFSQMERFREMMVAMDPDSYDESEDVFDGQPSDDDVASR